MTLTRVSTKEIVKRLKMKLEPIFHYWSFTDTPTCNRTVDQLVRGSKAEASIDVHQMISGCPNPGKLLWFVVRTRFAEKKVKTSNVFLRIICATNQRSGLL